MNLAQFPTLMAAFCGLLERQQEERLVAQGMTPARHNVKVTAKTGRRFVNVDIGTGGRYMVEILTGNIFGIKGYGQVHRGHFYGTLETTGEYFWGDYYPERLDGKLKKQKGNAAPVITHAPKLPVEAETEEQMDWPRIWRND